MQDFNVDPVNPLVITPPVILKVAHLNILIQFLNHATRLHSWLFKGLMDTCSVLSIASSLALTCQYFTPWKSHMQIERIFQLIQFHPGPTMFPGVPLQYAYVVFFCIQEWA